MIPEQRTPQLPQLVVVLTAVHTPLQHICPAAQDRPQAPQFELLLWTLTHRLPQRVVPAGHTQTPPVHVAPAGHAAPQEPQLASSVASVLQPVEHSVCPAGHWHRPPLQEAMGPQDRPQEPQAASSVARSRHAPPQHAGFAPPQRLPQAPQLFTSDERLGQLPPHGLGHTHRPEEQRLPDGQRLPHEPQFALSEPVSAQRPSQSDAPAGQRHTPAVHVCPPEHERPQAPQLRSSLSGRTQRPPHSISPAAQPQRPQSAGHDAQDSPISQRPLPQVGGVGASSGTHSPSLPHACPISRHRCAFVQVSPGGSSVHPVSGREQRVLILHTWQRVSPVVKGNSAQG